MRVCEVCGGVGDRAFDVDGRDGTHTFDSLDCALAGLTPRCTSCGTRVVGRGIEAAGHIYCIPCARQSPIRVDGSRG